MKRKISAVLISAVMLGAVSAGAAEPVSRYSMDNASTSGTASGTVTYTNGVSGSAARLSDNAYLTLPASSIYPEWRNRWQRHLYGMKT